MMQMAFFQPSTWSVTDITHFMRDLLESEETLQDLWVEGEVSNLSRPASAVGTPVFHPQRSQCRFALRDVAQPGSQNRLAAS